MTTKENNSKSNSSILRIRSELQGAYNNYQDWVELYIKKTVLLRYGVEITRLFS